MRWIGTISLALLFLASVLSHASNDFLDPSALAGMSNEDSKEDFDPIATMMRGQYINRAMMNGREWVERTEEQKQSYLLGYTDGTFNAAAYYIPTEAKRNAAILSLPTSQGKLPIEQLAREVDGFYADAKNRTIPISFALLVIRNRRALTGEGRSPERDAKIQAYIESLQQMFEVAPNEHEEERR